MLQRIQTIYLILAFVATGVLPFVFPLWIIADGKEYYFMHNQLYIVLFGLSTTLSLLSIISYKKRQNHSYCMLSEKRSHGSIFGHLNLEF